LTTKTPLSFFDILSEGLVLHLLKGGHSIVTIEMSSYGPIVSNKYVGRFLWTEQMVLEFISKGFKNGHIDAILITPRTSSQGGEAGEG